MPDHPSAHGGLPDPSHQRHLPPHISDEQLLRLRRQAFQLPQVVKPADFFDPQGSDFESRLDRHGYILLSRPAGGARPSRWIAPDSIDAALRHLDAVPAGPTARATMLQRAAALETLGITRRVDGWERLAHQTLPLAEVRLQLAYHVPIAAGPVWDFYREGDQPALLQALGGAPAAADAVELARHLDGLLADARQRSPQQLDTLLPRLQAELSRRRPAAGAEGPLQPRAVERWQQRVAELETLEGLNADLAFQGYPDTFAMARRLQRRVHAVRRPAEQRQDARGLRAVGAGRQTAPTWRRCACWRSKAATGCGRAASPARCSPARRTCPPTAPGWCRAPSRWSPRGKEIDLAVIDEAQMIFDPYRGWAWTQAIVGVPARELIIICSAYAVPAIENLLGLCGERCRGASISSASSMCSCCRRRCRCRR